VVLKAGKPFYLNCLAPNSAADGSNLQESEFRNKKALAVRRKPFLRYMPIERCDAAA